MIRIPNPDESIEGRGLKNKVCIFKMMLKVSVSLPLSLVVQEILYTLGMSPIQLKPNGWRNLLTCCVVAWLMVLGENAQLTAPEFLKLFSPVKFGNTWTL